MRTLVALDGSTLAEQALPYAVARLQQPCDELVLLRVKTSVDSEYEPERYLEKCAGRLREQGHLVRTLVRDGLPSEQIVAAAAEEAADLLLLSSHGYNGLSRVLLGSVAETVVRKSPCPVCMLPSRSLESPEPPAPGPWRSVLVPLDTSALAELALDYAAGLNPRPSLCLLTAVDMLANSLANAVSDAYEESVAALTAHLEARTAELRAQGWEVRQRVEQGFAAQSILEVAEQERVDAVIMATHGRTGWHRWLEGSVAERVVRQSSCPVILVKAPATLG